MMEEKESLRVALYVRVSTEEQAKEGYSIYGQVKVLTEYCKLWGHTVVQVYKDEGISAKNTARPSLQKMLSDCKLGSFNAVLVWKFNRISRNQADFHNMIGYFKSNRIKFMSFSENVDDSTAAGKLLMSILGGFAEFEREQIVENVKMGMAERAEKGKFNGGRVLGYKSVDKQLVIEPLEATLVRHIFELYVSGRGYKAIANQLNHEGYKTKTGNTFSTVAVKGIVTNPIYAGFITFNKQENWNEQRRKGKNENPILVRGVHEPIIDTDTWEKAQEIFQRKSHKPNKTFTGHFLLAGLLKCPTCGSSMVGHKVKKSKHNTEYNVYYQCGAFNNKGSAVCSSNMVRADYAESAVLERIQSVVLVEANLQAIVDKLNEKIANLKAPLLSQQAYTETQLDQATKNLNKLLTLFMRPNFESETVSENIMTLEREIKELKERKKEIDRELNTTSIEEVSFDQVQEVLTRFAEALPLVTPEKQKHILHSLIESITLNPSENIKGRTIKDITLVFDPSPNPQNDVLTYGTVHRTYSKHIVLDRKVRIII